MVLASGMWYGILTWAVASTADEIEDVARIVAGLNWAFLVMGLGVVGAIVWLARRHRASRAQDGKEGP
jgi:hypothetical protein